MAAVHHVVPALEPGETGEFIAQRDIVARHDSLNVCEHRFDVLNHEPVIDAGFLFLRCLYRSDVLALLLKLRELRFTKNIRPGTWRPKIRY